MVVTPRRVAMIIGAGMLVAVLSASALRWGPALARSGAAAHHVSSDAEYLGTALDGTQAPDFRLADQHGRATRLADFRGKTVALAFLDPGCTDACPLTAFHYRLAAEKLGNRADSVAFLAVNVNKNAASVQEMAEATRKWGNAGMRNWHFLTGSEAELRPVWDAYQIVAEGGAKPDKPDEQLHTPGVFLIDAAGRKRWYVSIPFQGGPDGTAWSGPALSEVLELRARQLMEEAR